MSENNVTKKRRRKIGDVVIAANGYSYTYIDGGDGTPVRVLTHHLVAKKKYGRPPTPDERVIFDDGDRTNLQPGNILYIKKSNPRASLKRRKASLEDRIRELGVELAEVNRLLENPDSA